MIPDANCARSPAARRLFLAVGVLLAFTGAAHAEPPIQSPQDAACRDVARSRVFSAPDPLNLGLREIGRQIYMACMQATKAGGGRRTRHRRRR